MHRIIVPVLIALGFISTLNTSCTKEVVKTVRDTTYIITRDTTVLRPITNLELIQGKWNTVNHEYELYSGGILSSKKVEYFTNYSFELKADGNYTVVNSEGTTTGKWELASSNNLVLDKNTAGERYFCIFYIEPKSMELRGPFKKNGDLKFNYLANTYYQKP